MNEKVHVIKDENLGGVLREFVEVDREAEVGDFVIRNGVVRKVTQRDSLLGSVGFEGYYEEGCDDKIIGWSDGAYETLEPTDIVHIDDPSGQPKRYRMAERKANVGERIIIIDADIADYFSNYKNGDVLTVFVIDYDGRVTEVKPNVFDDKIGVIMPYEYCVLEPVHDEETSPTVHEMLANLSERIVKLDHRISRLTDICEQSDSVIAREVERLGAELTKLKQTAHTQTITLTLDSAVLAKLIEKGLSE